MNKKLRLLVTTKCPNKCSMCCNNSWDFDKLPVVDRWNYDEIMITGGEPLLYPRNLFHLIKSIKFISEVEAGNTPKIYVYTAYCHCNIVNMLNSTYMNFRADGIVLTPHKSEDIDAFIHTNEFLLQYKSRYKNVSLRLNLFPDMKALLPKDIDLSLWQVKDMEWIKDCPVPEGEDFRRIANLW